jgi:hypothetical protein
MWTYCLSNCQYMYHRKWRYQFCYLCFFLNDAISASVGAWEIGNDANYLVQLLCYTITSSTGMVFLWYHKSMITYWSQHTTSRWGRENTTKQGPPVLENQNHVYDYHLVPFLRLLVPASKTSVLRLRSAGHYPRDSDDSNKIEENWTG